MIHSIKLGIYKTIVFSIVLCLLFISCKKQTTSTPNSNNTQSQNSYSLYIPQGPGLSNAGILIIFNGNLVAAHGDSVSQWTGTSWALIGSPFSGNVTALAIYNGNLVASGDATKTQGEYISVWTGSSWQHLGNAFNKSVCALIEYNGNLIAGGGFDTTHGGVANKIAEWNGTNWFPIADSGMQVYSYGVCALTVYNGNLIIAGGFYYDGKIQASNIASFNGSTWANLGSVNQIVSTVYSLTVFNGNLIAGGSFTGFSDSLKFIALWNGSTWSNIGTSRINGPVVNSLLVYNNNLIAGGAFAGGLAEYNGSAWSMPFGSIYEYYIGETEPESPFLVPGPPEINSLVVYNGNLVVCGSF